MSKYEKEFQVKSVSDNKKRKMEDEVELKYSAFAMEAEPDSKVRFTIHSDRKIDLNPGDILKVAYTKN